MRTITTRNSVYEVDAEAKLVRRVSGKNDPPSFIGEDGAWRPYVEMRHLGETILFVGPGHLRGFITSSVIDSTEG